MPFTRSLLALVSLSLLAQAAELRNLKEEVIKGELVAIDATTITLKTDSGNIVTPLNTVLQLEMKPATTSGSFTLVELTDGSILHCKPETGFKVDGKQVELTLLSDRKIQAPLSALSLILKNAQDPKVRSHADWKTVLKNRKNRDFFVRWSDGRMNPIPGTFGEGKDSILGFQTESGLNVQVDLNHQAVVGWVFVNKPDPNLPLPVCTVVDEHDNTILVKRIASDGAEVVASTLFGFELRFKPDQLARLDFSGGKRVYLSELAPRIIEERPDDKNEPLRKDKNPDDGPLLLGGKKFAKGLSLFAPMVLAYPLGGEYKEFTATLGVDDNVGGNTHVKVVIEGDGRELYAQEIKKNEPPRDVRLNVKDIQELRLKVHPIGVLPIGHHIDIADAKVTK